MKIKRFFFQARKSFLIHDGKAWIKRESESFDVSMGSFDSAEISDLCGLYLLSLLPSDKLSPGLYRDDGLIASPLTPRQNEILKKKICKIFNDNGLKITITANLKSVDFLDITLDLTSDVYKPFMKPNDKPLYIRSQSNHPPNILRNIPDAVNNKLSRISFNENVFNDAASPYQKALDESGFKHQLKYKPPYSTKKKNRSRNVTWFNPPF